MTSCVRVGDHEYSLREAISKGAVSVAVKILALFEMSELWNDHKLHCQLWSEVS